MTEPANDDARCEAVLFNERGKYKYALLLDYSWQTDEDFEHWDLRSQAIEALKRSTRAGTSGVSLDHVPDGWTLVVMAPRSMNSYPTMVRGGFSGLADRLFSDAAHT
jgi:hypothetical protein